MTDQAKPEPTPEDSMVAMRVHLDDLYAWLKKRGLQIVPGWAPFLPVGNDGTTFQISSRWVLSPLPEQE